MTTLYFPDEFDLEPVSFHGPVPRKDEVIYISNWDVNDIDPRYNFSSSKMPSSWRVKRVDYGIRVWGNYTKRIESISSPTIKVDVILEINN